MCEWDECLWSHLTLILVTFRLWLYLLQPRAKRVVINRVHSGHRSCVSAVRC